jgi:DNA-binding CsgD family transcriptional regulator
MNLIDVPSVSGPRLPTPFGPSRGSQDATLLKRLLDEIDYGLLLINGQGRLRYANQLALQEFRNPGALTLTAGCVAPADMCDRGALCAALADAIRGRRTLITLGTNGHALSIAVVPMEGDDEPLALLVLNKRQSCTALTVDFYARAKGLTHAEATVLLHLSQGAKPKGIARRLGVALSTVRSQISSIREKTQTASIGDLADRVARLPPFAPALKSTPSGWGFEPTLDDAHWRTHSQERLQAQSSNALAC